MTHLLYAEVSGETLRLWQRIDLRARDFLKLHFSYVTKIEANKIFFAQGGLDDDDRPALRSFEDRLLTFIRRSNPNDTLRSLNISYMQDRISLDSLAARIDDFHDKFAALSFGSDVAEQDNNLLEYFIETPSYDRVEQFKKGIVIGPKGSGKSSILKALTARNTSDHTIVITPEVFATSMLQQIIEEGGQNWDEERAFAATWEFSILFEVFKQMHLDRRGIPKSVQSEVARFLKSNSEFETGDLFSRFIRYLRKIQSVKVAGIEIAVKARELQALYALEPVYALVLRIRNHLRRNIVILIDELDQGWDNSDHSNRFLAGLLQAAVQIQNLGIQAH
ncbi:MAG TPA: hypothetical protein VE843_00315, partial [Ktedonobacteraceae bacterium]|nr:hypothetical protein [Ktedonobacteraceae bacterium]